MKESSKNCIDAATQTGALVENAYEGRYLSKLNPFATYSIWTAALIIFANEYARLSSDALLNQCMANAITILWSNGEMDPQAARAANILVDFRTIINKRKEQFALRLRPLHYQNENPP
jgi:hypothetical protein